MVALPHPFGSRHWGRAAEVNQIVHERTGHAPFPQFGSGLHESYDVIGQLAVAHVLAGNAVIIMLCHGEVVSISHDAEQAVKYSSDVHGPKRVIERHPLTVGVELSGICDWRYCNQKPTDETKHLCASLKELPAAQGIY
jgi:hypothetical protein